MEYLVRVCRVCFEEKLMDDFFKAKGRKYGRRNECKLCFSRINKDYLKKNPGYHNKNRKMKKAKDESYKISELLSRQLTNCLRIKQKKSKLEKNLDCSLEILYKWIEFQFDENMSWENYGKYWWIDHILPKSHFNHTNEEELMLCWNFRNLCPVTKEENMSKGNKIDYQLYYRNVSLASEFLDEIDI